MTVDLWILGGVPFLALQTPALREGVQAVDDVVHQLAVNSEVPFLVWLATGLDFLGSTWVTTPVIVAVGAYLALARRWSGLLYCFMSMLLSRS